MALTICSASCKSSVCHPKIEPANVSISPRARCLVAIAILSFQSCRSRVDRLWENFSGEKAFAHVQHLVDLGPRPAGSEALEKSRLYIIEKLRSAGWSTMRSEFSGPTPRGTMTFVNLVARFGNTTKTESPQFLLCSHYDTKTFDTIRFVGANDGGSSTGLLIEMARVLALNPALAAKIELVFFDGEEAFENFNETDGLYGSRHFAAELRSSGQQRSFRGGILFDMIGDKSLQVTLPPDSPRDLAGNIFAAADTLEQRLHFTYVDRGITDDHTPLNRIGIPVIDLIDFDFPPWHTAEDTLDKISAESLETIGRVALYDLAKFELK
jgi:glutaminyl-peptide cyclotransferase